MIMLLENVYHTASNLVTMLDSPAFKCSLPKVEGKPATLEICYIIKRTADSLPKTRRAKSATFDGVKRALLGSWWHTHDAAVARYHCSPDARAASSLGIL